MSTIKANINNKNTYLLLVKHLINKIDKNTIIICIGSDKCIGDALGPLVGTLLKACKFPLPTYGSLDTPIHALNIEKEVTNITSLHPNSSIIGIDACLGNKNSIGEIHLRDSPIHPGKGVGKTLPDVGSMSLIGIVDSIDNSKYFTSKPIRLSFILDMAIFIVNCLMSSISEK